MTKTISITIPAGFEKLLNLQPIYRELIGGMVYIEAEPTRALQIFIKGLSNADQN